MDVEKIEKAVGDILSLGSGKSPVDVKTRSIKVFRLNKSLYLGIPAEIVKRYNIERNEEFSLDVYETENSVELRYRKFRKK